MYRTFNMGIGLILVAPAQDAAAVIADLAARGETAFVIGEVVPGEKTVTLK
jgi:phosphoribosylformylglycinamidine cyclo-ligase